MRGKIKWLFDKVFKELRSGTGKYSSSKYKHSYNVNDSKGSISQYDFSKFSEWKLVPDEEMPVLLNTEEVAASSVLIYKPTFIKRCTLMPHKFYNIYWATAYWIVHRAFIDY